MAFFSVVILNEELPIYSFPIKYLQIKGFQYFSSLVLYVLILHKRLSSNGQKFMINFIRLFLANNLYIDKNLEYRSFCKLQFSDKKYLFVFKDDRLFFLKLKSKELLNLSARLNLRAIFQWNSLTLPLLYIFIMFLLNFIANF